MRIRGIDWGSYLTWNQLIQIPFKELVENAGIKFFITKSDQEQIDPVYGNYSTLKNMQAARDAGIKRVGNYVWSFPNGNLKYWLDRYKRSIDKEKPDFIYIDIEQWDDGAGNRVDPQRMSDFNQGLYEGLVSLYPERQVGIYTRKDIVTYWSPPMSKWIGKANGTGWLASWPDYGLLIYNFTWQQIIQNMVKRNLDTTGKVTTNWDIVTLTDDWGPSNLNEWDKWSIWQYSSRMRYPIIGWPYDNQTDWCFFNGTEEDMDNWIAKKEVQPMASIYEFTTPQSKRGRLVQIDGKTKTANNTEIITNSDAVVLKMGGMDGKKGGGNELYEEPGYAIRVNQFPKKIALFNLDAGYWLWKQMNQGPVEEMQPEDNPVIKKIQYLLSLGKVNALMLHIGEDKTHLGKPIEDTWQKSTLLNVLDKILVLQDKKQFPDIKIIVRTDPWFLLEYPNEFSTYLYGKKDRVYVSLADFTGFTPTPGPHVNSLKTVFDTWYPPDSFKYYALPFGYYKDELGNEDRVVMHWYSSMRYFVDGMLVSNTNEQVPVDIFLWCDTKEKLDLFLGEGDIIVPSSSTSPSASPSAQIPSELEEKVSELERQVLDLYNLNAGSANEIGKLIRRVDELEMANKKLIEIATNILTYSLAQIQGM